MSERKLDSAIFFELSRKSTAEHRENADKLDELKEHLDELVYRQQNGEGQRFRDKLEAVKQAVKRRRETGVEPLPGVRESGRGGDSEQNADS